MTIPSRFPRSIASRARAAASTRWWLTATSRVLDRDRTDYVRVLDRALRATPRWLERAASASARSVTALAAAAVGGRADDDHDTAPGAPEPVAGAWSFAVLPDTQKYSARFPDIFAAQTRWIADNARALGIRFAVHVGDIVDVDTPEQWQAAVAALRILDGRVPCALAPGNHDYAGNGKVRTSMLNEHFTAGELRTGAVDAGAFDPPRIDSSYRVVDTPSGPWLVLALEFAPRDEVIAWADHVLARHRDLPAVVATHAYLYSDSTRYDRRRRPHQRWSPCDYRIGENDGADLWDKLIGRHDNVAFVLSGHILGGGLGRLSSARASGTTVHQLVANYQMRPHGGGGYLRFVQIDSTAGTAHVRTYSPYLNRSLVDAANHFTLDLTASVPAPTCATKPP